MASPDEIRANLRASFERLIAAGGESVAAELYHPDYVNHEADPEPSSRIEGAIATGTWLRQCFGPIRWEIHQIIVEGDFAAAHVTMHGTHNGGLPPGVPGTGKEFSVRHVHLVRCAEDGRALEHWAVRDDLRLAMQIGMIGGPPAEGAA